MVAGDICGVTTCCPCAPRVLTSWVPVSKVRPVQSNYRKTGTALAYGGRMPPVSQNDEPGSPLRERRWAHAAFSDRPVELPPRWQKRAEVAEQIAEDFGLPLRDFLEALRRAANGYWLEMEPNNQHRRQGHGSLAEAKRGLSIIQAFKKLFDGSPEYRNRLELAAIRVCLAEVDTTSDEDEQCKEACREATALLRSMAATSDRGSFPFGRDAYPAPDAVEPELGEWVPDRLLPTILSPSGLGVESAARIASVLGELCLLALNATGVEEKRRARGKYAELTKAATPLIAYWEARNGRPEAVYVWEAASPIAEFLSRCLSILDEPAVKPGTVVRVLKAGAKIQRRGL